MRSRRLTARSASLDCAATSSVAVRAERQLSPDEVCLPGGPLTSGAFRMGPPVCDGDSRDWKTVRVPLGMYQTHRGGRA